ncbi:hypothetical protein QGN29_11080 [Temperatibacter marinus]|uniref:Uncharacterized protein n=1 Tax=Temperatibacter marinus TaxID=1456591 RepID=A0AA52H8G0_9PROT|nr:hypothetical protein [Temperatibacter marinus]WND02091.1 hypothetical protein QGN29_11080 [Temperatibacter marinus]
MTSTLHQKMTMKERYFQLFKYIIYILLLYSVIAFFIEDHQAAQFTFKDGISFSNLYQAYPQFIDTLAWYVLLMLFELETYVIEDDDFYDKVKWIIRPIYALCYTSITLAFLGYFEQMLMIYQFEFTEVTDACTLIGSNVTAIALELNEYVELTAANCSTATAPLYIQEKFGMIADDNIFILLKRLIMTDVVNAGSWLLIVVLLQIDVLLQLMGRLTDGFYRTNLYVKLVLYVVLFVCAGYWWVFGNYLDFQDAVLWILAFFFIEMNLFKWHEEEQDESSKKSAQ